MDKSEASSNIVPKMVENGMEVKNAAAGTGVEMSAEIELIKSDKNP